MGIVFFFWIYAIMVCPQNAAGWRVFARPPKCTQTEKEAHFLKRGMRVAVSFGKSKIYTALVYAIHQNPPTLYKAKDIYQILDEDPIVNETQLEHWEWLARYYMCSIGEVYRAALPSAFLLESETIVYKNEAFTALEELSDDAYLIFEALENHSQLTIHQVTEK